MLADHADHILGVDTHKDSHSTAVLAAKYRSRAGTDHDSR